MFLPKNNRMEIIDMKIFNVNVILAGDIGGSMGLFVGASVITVFELCDALLHNFLKLKMNPPARNQRRRASVARRQNGKV